MKITSSVFADNEKLPQKYSCDGDAINPPLSFSEVPSGAKSLALIMYDPDAPSGMFVHWIIWNLPPSILGIEEGQSPNAVIGTGSSGKNAYMGPCPPSGSHRYIFELYALDNMLNIGPDSGRETLLKTIGGHIVGKSTLTSTYERGA